MRHLVVATAVTALLCQHRASAAELGEVVAQEAQVFPSSVNDAEHVARSPHSDLHDDSDAGETTAHHRLSDPLQRLRVDLAKHDGGTAHNAPSAELFSVQNADGRTWHIGINDGAVWRFSKKLDFEMPVTVADYPALDASAMFGSRAWGLVLVQGDEGHGNNASGHYEYVVAFFVARGDELELAATQPIGYTAFSRAVTEEGFVMSEAHTLLCPSIRKATLHLSAACRGRGDPRAFGLPLRELCAQAKNGKCPPGGNRPDPLVRKRVGTSVARGGTFVVAAAAPHVKELSALRVLGDHTTFTDGRTRWRPDLFVSERPWEHTEKQPVEWLELQNNTKLWVDLHGLRLDDERHATGELKDSCILGPEEVVVLRRGQGPSWNARSTECFFGDAQLVGRVELSSPQGILADSWPTHGLGFGYSLQMNAGGSAVLAKENPGVVNR